MTTLPTGTVTFLFTDLEGSTRLWQESPDAMQAALARHDAILRSAIEAEAGAVVKGSGDGVHAVFAAAEAAIGAAIAAQRALRSEIWPTPSPLRVRMGIHSGVAELRAGDYYGSAVNRAARLMSAAHGGQIVVSLATEALVQDAELDLLDLGEHALRDLSRPERVFQVVHPDLDTEFPPLASLDAFGGNLPVQVTSFVGREADVARIAAMLDETAMVTLTGTGGVGKTRLALQVAAEAVPRFRDGAWLCELAAVDDVEGMVQVVATTLGCVPRAGLSLAESVVEYLKVRSLLLVLDNCEQLLDDAGALAEAVLRRCPEVTVLATSREALDVDGERIVRVRSLEAPEPGVRGDALARSAAVRLFADRAADAGVLVTWNDAQWAAVGEICRRVDGIPLAIELAAARTASMTPADIAAHLDERFRLLTGKRRGRVERHQTLRATVEWSYHLLGSGERAIFDRLGVFTGGFTAPAAVAVAGDGLNEWDVIDGIASLVAKSMLTADDIDGATARYAMLETLRQFARERLDEAGDAERLRRRHAEYYAEWAGRAAFGMIGSDGARWVNEIRSDLDNVRAAVAWGLDADDADARDIGLRIIAALADFGNIDHDSGIGAFAVRALPLIETSAPEIRGALLSAAGYEALNHGDFSRARQLLRRAVEAGVLTEAPNPFVAFTNLAYVELLLGNLEALVEIGNVTRPLAEGIDSAYARAMLLAGLASFAGVAGLVEQARHDAEQALALAVELGNPIALANAHHGTAWALQRADPAGALAAAEAYLALYREESVMVGSAGSVLALAGGLRSRIGDPAGGLRYLREAVIVSRDQGVRSQLAASLEWSLAPLVKTGAVAVAATLIGALAAGALAGLSDFPGVADSRARVQVRIEAALGAEETARLRAAGAAMTYDALVAYALDRITESG